MFSSGKKIRATQWHTRAKRAAWLTAFSSALWLSGCATPAANPQEAVRKLAQQRWDHVLAGKYDKSYDMLVPSYRKLKSLDHYNTAARSAPVKWKSAEVVRVECDTKTCKVVVKVVSQLIMPTFYKGPLVSGLDETWVFEDGQWWKLETL